MKHCITGSDPPPIRHVLRKTRSATVKIPAAPILTPKSVARCGLQQLDGWKGGQIENETGYTTDLLTRHATDFITRHKDKPFFLYLAHAAPHDPLQVRDPDNRKSPAITKKYNR